MPRRSTIVNVTLVGLVGGVAIGSVLPVSGAEMRRNLYGDRAACERDYSPSQCEANSSTGGGGGYHGPYYSATRNTVTASDPGPGRTGAPASVQTSVRGGFGSFGRAAGAPS
jgi:hypothetical protein